MLQTSSCAVPRQDFEDAPDLVIGLPIGSTGTQSSPKSLLTDTDPRQPISDRSSTDSSSSSDGGGASTGCCSQEVVTSPTRSLTAAEMFANANQSTIKKATVLFLLLGPFYGAIAAPSVTRCRCRCRRGHRTPPAKH